MSPRPQAQNLWEESRILQLMSLEGKDQATLGPTSGCHLKPGCHSPRGELRPPESPMRLTRRKQALLKATHTQPQKCPQQLHEMSTDEETEAQKG